MPSGTLYVVGTPLGNLEDLSPRAIRVLGAVAVVAAEDTRTAQKLWARFGLAPHTVSYFEGNEASRAEELVARLLGGDDVAVISEAGMPGVSDPGERLVQRAVAAGVEVVVVPGPSAAVTALAGSGLSTAAFTFLGFLPREGTPRRALLARLRPAPETLIFYEAPGRTAATLSDLADSLGGGRRACVARELTKVHEEFSRGTLTELAARTARRGHAGGRRGQPRGGRRAGAGRGRPRAGGGREAGRRRLPQGHRRGAVAVIGQAAAADLPAGAGADAAAGGLEDRVRREERG